MRLNEVGGALSAIEADMFCGLESGTIGLAEGGRVAEMLQVFLLPLEVQGKLGLHPAVALVWPLGWRCLWRVFLMLLELVLQIQEEDMLIPSLPAVCLPKAHSPTPPPEASSSCLSLSGLRCSSLDWRHWAWFGRSGSGKLSSVVSNSIIGLGNSGGAGPARCPGGRRWPWRER